MLSAYRSPRFPLFFFACRSWKEVHRVDACCGDGLELGHKDQTFSFGIVFRPWFARGVHDAPNASMKWPWIIQQLQGFQQSSSDSSKYDDIQGKLDKREKQVGNNCVLESVSYGRWSRRCSKPKPTYATPALLEACR